MKTRSMFIATVVALASGLAFADDPTPDTYASQPSLRSRAEVKADVHVAKALGQLQPAGEREAAPSVVPTFALARSSVKAEVRAASAAGQLMRAGELIDGASQTLPANHAGTTLARR